MDVASGAVGFPYGINNIVSITFDDGTNIYSKNQFVTSVNGNTGTVDVVESFAGFTGDVAVGVTSHQVLFAATGGLGITGSDDFLFDMDTGVLTIGQGGYLDGNVLGAIKKLIIVEETSGVSAGDPLYIAESTDSSGKVRVQKADASDSTKMPAAGVAGDDYGFREEGFMIITGVFNPYDTTGLTSNDSFYVASGGGLTTERPSGANDLIQNMARVGRQDSSNGNIIVAGAFRTNDVPNILKVYSHLEMPDGFTADTIVSSVNGTTGSVSFNAGTNITLTTGNGGITVDAAGGGGGTYAYSGHIESAVAKRYYLDPTLPVGITITEFYAVCATGGCTAEISSNGSSIGTIQVSTTPTTASLTNTSLSSGNTLDMIITDSSGCFDYRFSVKYQR